jgi:hypothetical protein
MYMYSKHLIITFFCLLSNVLIGQTKIVSKNDPSGRSSFQKDSSSIKKAKGFKKIASIDMYLQYNTEMDTAVVDTTVSIKKDYKFNYLQKDNFGLMPFANMGQTYNTLTFNTSQNTSVPLFGARAKHFNYMTNSDINYYEVPTPWTRLTYKTGFGQGQMLDAFFTINLSKQFNFSIAYKGLRSLGDYQNTLSSSGNFRFTTNYKSKNERYRAKAHIVIQDILNQENGGISNDDIVNFESGNEEFLDRSVFDPNFDNAENILKGKLFFLNQSYDIVKKSDSLSNNRLSIINTISLEDKYFQFSQASPALDFFGDSFTSNISDKVTLENFETSLGINYSNNTLGDVMLAVKYTDVNYGYNSVVLFPGEIIPNRIKASFIGLEAGYSKTYKGFTIKTNGGLNLSEEFVGSFLNGVISLNVFDDVSLSGGININTRLANYNHLLYQSDYINYNWHNFNDFKNINTQQLNISLKSQKYFNADLDISNIDNYTYFNLEDQIDEVKIIAPRQYNRPLQYIRLKFQKEFRVGNLALDNTIMYQNVVSDEDVLNVPTFIARNTLYYSNQLFKKAMTLQTGVTFNYFTEYNMNGYDPLLAEFYTQNQTKLGGFPRLDFFVNAKIRQTRIFVKAEHFNSSFTGYDYFSAPNQPFRDFTIRFGLVWDFFL